MIETACLCGEIRVAIDATPAFIHACNCDLCTKTGAHWGYFHPAQVKITGTGSCFCRTDKAEPTARVHFCAVCGCTTHFTLTEAAVAQFGDTMMGVNMRLAGDEALVGVELRYPDGRAWSGSGDFSYVRAPDILGA